METSITLPQSLTMEQDKLIAVLTNSVYPGASVPSVAMVIEYCRANMLDPLQKPCHIVPMYDSKLKEYRDVIMPGIGLYRIQAARTQQCGGVSEPEFGPDMTIKLETERYTDKWNKSHVRDACDLVVPEWCKVTVTRVLPNGMKAEFTAIEYWLENYATAGRNSKHPNEMWMRRRRGQLAKCTEAQALRKAFPEFASAPTFDEVEGREEIYMGSADVIEEPTKPDMPQRKSDPKPAAAEPEQPTGPETIEGTATRVQESAPAEPPAENEPRATPGMLKMIAAKAEHAGISTSAICMFAAVESLEQLTVKGVNSVLKFISEGGQQ